MTLPKQRTVALIILVCVFCSLTWRQGHAQLLTGYQPAETYLDYGASDMPEPAAPSSRSAPMLTAQATQAVPPSAKSYPPENFVMPDAERESQAPVLVQAAATAPQAPAKKAAVSQTPVDLTADNLQHDEKTGEITASGHVELVRGGRILRADTVSYNMNTDTVTAKGNVSLTEPNGDVHFADEVQLTNEMREGFVRGLQSYLAQGGHFTADEAQRINEKLIVMHNAAYTPCDCEEDNEGDPAWQIKADKVTLDENEHNIKYKNAKFEIFGIPVMWLPFMSQPDGKEKRKSGFLTPQVGFNSQLGVMVTQNYYYDIAPDKDATVGMMLTSQEAPVALGEYRQRFAQADLKVDVSATRSNRKDQVGIDKVVTGEEFRGHMFAKGQWSMNEKWRSGVNLELTTDDQYLRQYDFSSKDVLENELYVERFSGRNYAVGRLLAFQDVRVADQRTDQPNVLPEIEMNFVGEPNALLTGRWNAQLSMLDLQRNGGQDMMRAVGKVGWEKKHVTSFGLVSTLDLSMRADAYRVSDRDVAQPGNGRSNTGTDTRFLPQGHLVTSLPFVKPLEKAQVVVEPVAALTVAPNIKDVGTNIPNEDSQDVQVDASNIFEPNRFPGKDRLEDRSHVTYGVRTGVYGHGGSYGDVFIGQSYRFNESDNPFPVGSGLERQESDWVGQVSGNYDGRYGVNYRFQLNGSDFSSTRHEVDGFADFGRLNLSTRYLYAAALGGTDISESREQIYTGASYDLTHSWRMRGSVLEDLGTNPGLREAALGIDYFGCCLSFSTTVKRTVTSDVTGDSGTNITFRIGLKGLGEFQTADDGSYSGSNSN